MEEYRLGLRPTSCRLLFIILAFVVGFLLALPEQANGNKLYVSKAYGNDSNNACQNMTSPCKTLDYVIAKASSDDVIMIDATLTALQPYNNCFSGQFRGSLQLISWKGHAVINCTGQGLFFNGSSTSGNVRLRGLTFFDTFLMLSDISLTVDNCTFGSFSLNRTYLYIINFSITTISSNLILTNSSFVENNSAGCLYVVNSGDVGVFLEITNSSMIANAPKQAPSLICIQGKVNFSFLDSEVSNTIFANNVFQPSIITFTSIVVLKTSKLGQQGNFVEKHTDIQDENPSLSFRFLRGTFHGNNAKIVLALFSSAAQVVIEKTNISETVNSDVYSPGGVIVLSSKNTRSFDVRFKDCWFTSNQGISYSTVFYFEKDDSSVSNIHLEDCHFNNNHVVAGDESAGNTATVYIDAPQISLNVHSCEFQFNRAGAAGAVLIRTSLRSNLVFSHILVDSCSCWNEAAELSCGITVIIDHPSKSNDFSKFGLMINNSQFRNNSVRLIGTGALLLRSSQGLNSLSGDVTITGSKFIGNFAHAGVGGIHISNSNFNCNISHTEFRDNAGFLSGAIYFNSAGNIKILNCTLEDNFGGSTTSTFASGSIRLGSNGEALIQDSRIIQSKMNRSFGPSDLTFHGGVGISSREFGSIHIRNSLFDFKWQPTLTETIVMEFDLSDFHILDNKTIIRCPKNCRIKKLKSEQSQPSHGPQIVSYQCRMCSMDSYSEESGYYSGLSNKHRIRCLHCPYGAICMGKLQVLPNFWGDEIKNSSPPAIAFYRCPLGYCCDRAKGRKSCFPYNTCNSDRRGRLCGECNSQFSETLFSPSCRKSKKCNDFWFWPLAVLFVLGFSLYLIVQPDFIDMLWKWVTWFRRDNSHGTPAEDREFDPGFERIVFFYYQAADILIVQSSFDVWNNYFSQLILGFFNFETRLNKVGFACPFPGLNPVSKVFFQSLGVCSVLLAIPFIYVCHCLSCFCLRRDRPKSGPYLSAFVKGLLLGYAVLTEKTIKLLTCVDINGINCLFVNCNIQCYTWWQKVIGTLVPIYFVPFTLVLFFGSYKLFNKRISTAHFILACFFPLPVLSYWLITRRTFHFKHVPDTNGRDAVTSLLIGSYRAPDHVSRGAIFWESVLMGRMLILILASVLIKEPFLRSLTLLFFCIINLSVHIYVLPFELPAANKAEILSLFSLVLVAITGVPFSGYHSEGVAPSRSISHIIDVFSWCQTVLVGFLPFLVILLTLIAVLSQTVRLVCFLSKWLRCACCTISCCCARYLRGSSELTDPMIIT